MDSTRADERIGMTMVAEWQATTRHSMDQDANRRGVWTGCGCCIYGRRATDVLGSSTNGDGGDAWTAGRPTDRRDGSFGRCQVQYGGNPVDRAFVGDGA